VDVVYKNIFDLLKNYNIAKPKDVNQT